MRSGGTRPCIGGMRARERTSVRKSELLSYEGREVPCVACSRRAASSTAANSRFISRSFSFLCMRACTRVAAASRASRASLSARACCSVRFASKERALACSDTAFIISCIARCSFSALHRCSRRRSRRRRRRRHKRHSSKAPSKATVPVQTPISMLLAWPDASDESPVLIVGGTIETMVRDVMVGVDVTVTPKKELAADASETAEEAILSSMAAVAFAVAVVMMMSTRVDAALAITLTLLGPTPAVAAIQAEIKSAMLFSRADVKASIGSAATKLITTWNVIVVIDPGTAGDGGDSGEGGGDGSSGHSARIEL